MKDIAFTGLLAALFLSGCVSSPPSKAKKAEPPVQKEKTAPEAYTASMAVSSGDEVKSVDSGSLSARHDPLPEGLGETIVVITEHEYYQYGKEATSTFELVYSGVRIDPSLAGKDGAEIESEATLGSATGTEVRLTARSKELDPYLVACSDALPVFEDGYWYFAPGMYMPKQMKWLSYEPVDMERFRWMYGHALEEENAHSLTTFMWWSLLKTELPSYPALIEEKSRVESEQIIDLDGMALHLFFQSGFLDYLEAEYRPGDPIYLYLQISGIDGPKGEFQCYVRDFSLIPPERIVEDRMKAIQERGESI